MLSIINSNVTYYVTRVKHIAYKYSKKQKCRLL
jgi:hypothetical protein